MLTCLFPLLPLINLWLDYAIDQTELAPKPAAGVLALHNNVTGCFSAGSSNSVAGGSQDLLQPNNLALSWCKYLIPHPQFFLPQLLPAPLGSKSILPLERHSVWPTLGRQVSSGLLAACCGSVASVSMAWLPNKTLCIRHVSEQGRRLKDLCSHATYSSNRFRLSESGSWVRCPDDIFLKDLRFAFQPAEIFLHCRETKTTLMSMQMCRNCSSNCRISKSRWALLTESSAVWHYGAVTYLTCLPFT